MVRNPSGTPTLRLYLRRSKGDDHQQFSLDVQREGCHRFVVGNAALGSVSWIERVEYVDDDRSGDDFAGREALARLRTELRAGDVVVCRDQSRLGRDALEVTLAIRDLVRDRGARLYYYATGKQVEFATAIDAAMTFIQGTGHQMELEAIRSRTREALRSRVRAGRIAGGRCFGYSLKRVEEGGGRSYTIAVVDEEQAQIVRRIFDEFLSGNGLKKITMRLNADRILSPAAGRRGTGSWSPSCVRAILRNERYRGVYIHGVVNRVRRGGKRKAERATPDQVLTVEVPDWRIVSDAVWYATRELVVKRSAVLVKTGRAAKHALAGIGRCAHCGGSIGGLPQKISGGKRVVGYGCRWHDRRGAAVCPVTVRQPADEVEAMLADYLQTRVLTPELTARVVAAIRREIDEQLAAHVSDTEALETELRALKVEQKNLGRAIAIGGGEISELVVEMRERNERIRRLEANLEVARRSPEMIARLRADAERRAAEGLANLRAALASDPRAAREVYQALFPDGLDFIPAEALGPTGRPRRVWRVRGRARLGGSTFGCDPTGT